MRNKCVFLEYFEGWATKDVCFVSVFVVILIASVVSRPSGFWKNLKRCDHVCKEIWLVTFIYAGMRRLGVTHLGVCLPVMTDPFAPQVLSIKADDKTTNVVTAGTNAGVLEQATAYISLLTLLSTIMDTTTLLPCLNSACAVT